VKMDTRSSIGFALNAAKVLQLPVKNYEFWSMGWNIHVEPAYNITQI
jgi:hypothetical protein